MRLNLSIVIIALLLSVNQVSAGFPDSAHACLFLGNSNTEAYKADPIVDPQPTTPMGGTMWSIGPRVFPNGGGAFTALDVSTLGSEVPVHEVSAPGYVAGWPLGETDATAFANAMAAKNYPVFVMVVGQANTRLDQISKGTLLYANSLTAIRHWTASHPGGWVDCIISHTGETDALDGVTQAAFAAQTVKLKADYDSDIRAITHQTRDPVWLSQETTTSSTPGIGQAQYDVSWNDIGFRIVAPLYNLGFEPDGFHLTAIAHHYYGELAARAFAGWLGLGPAAWPPLQAYHARRIWLVQPVPTVGRHTGNLVLATHTPMIQVDYYVPTPPIRWLPGASTHPARRGFIFVDCNSNWIPVTNVSVIGPKNLMLTLATTPACDGTVRYGWDALGLEGTGGQGIVADSNFTPSTYDGTPLYDAALATLTPTK